MSIGPRLDLRQSQSLVVTPQLQAAIKLLTLSNLELAAHIESELENNPLLERADADEGVERTADAAGDTYDEAPVTDAAESLIDGVAPAESIDADIAEERFHHDAPSDRPSEAGESLDFDSFAGAAATLHDLLLDQARAALARGDLVIAEHLIDAIDDAGYLRESTFEVAARLGADPSRVEHVLSVIQGFEPTGVGARTLAECLAIQAREADRYDPCMAALIDNLDLVARGDLSALRRVCDVDAEDLADMLRELRGYNPKPGLTVGAAGVEAVVPDLFVRRGPGGWTVELNNATLPRLIVNRQYQRTVTASGGKAERAFAEDAANRAQWLVRTLDQRANTILRVGAELVRHQSAFFERGVQALRPLTLRAVADAVGLHESTVSRVTSNKHLHCSRGLFELKYFFTNAIPQGASDASSESVRQRIRDLIDSEPPLKPLSDDKIVELLRAEGLDLARRTVTKYREAMHIPSSFDRRRRALLAAA
jgi:RNA polymerase sigma-54 factor